MTWMIHLLFFFFTPPFELERLQIQPFDFQDEAEHVYNIDQLAVEKGRLFIRSGSDPFIYVLSKDQVLKALGGKGQGPGELGYGAPLAMSPAGDSLWVVDAERRLHWFKNDVHHGSFRLKSYTTLRNPGVGGAFPVGSDWAVVPCEPSHGALALRYDSSGKVSAKVGRPLDSFDDVPELARFRDVTLWSEHGDGYVALFAYFPLMIRFDKQFHEISRFPIMDPEVSERFGQLATVQDHGNVPNPLFTSLQSHEGKLYVMFEKLLLELSNDGETLRKTAFYGRGPAFVDLPPETNYAFPHFVFWHEQLILGHWAMLRDHDLWKVPGYGRNVNR